KKHRKARKDRQYSHDYEWEMDVIQFIENKIMSGQTFLDGMNQKDLADEIGVPVASFKRLLQKSTKIVKKVEGQGRNAVTLLSTEAIILKSAIK
ncbi:plasmid replication protein, partial [Listeria seeligeri]|nr:plasmid replication protein [Listeria seeligeri]